MPPFVSSRATLPLHTVPATAFILCALRPSPCLFSPTARLLSRFELGDLSPTALRTLGLKSTAEMPQTVPTRFSVVPPCWTGSHVHLVPHTKPMVDTISALCRLVYCFAVTFGHELLKASCLSSSSSYLSSSGGHILHLTPCCTATGRSRCN